MLVGAEADESLTGVVLGGRWRVERLIGQGGMSSVYAARRDDGTMGAVKVPRRFLAQNPQARARFLREGQVGNAIGHPNAVRVLDTGTDASGHPFLVMELLDGETLRQRRVTAGGQLDAPEVLRIAEGVLDVLVMAHARHVVHRDIKPENVFLARSGEVKVLDFGIAAVRDEAMQDAQLTESGVSLGTPAFMAPEQARGRHSSVDGRTDVWSLGATMFLCLTGRHVHDEASTANEALIFSATQRAPSLRTVRTDLPADVGAVVDRALALDPKDRWQTAAAMRDAIRRAADAARYPQLAEAPPLGGDLEPTHDGTLAAPAPRGTARGARWVPWAVASLALGAVVAGAAALSLHGSYGSHGSRGPLGSDLPSASVAAIEAPSGSPRSGAGGQPSTPAPSSSPPSPSVASVASAASAAGRAPPIRMRLRPFAAPPASAGAPDTIPDDVLDRRK